MKRKPTRHLYSITPDGDTRDLIRGGVITTATTSSTHFWLAIPNTMEGDCMDADMLLNGHTNRQLLDIRKEMSDLIDTGDPERTHGEADQLLKTLIEVLMTKWDVAERGTIREILENYDDVPKWYA